MQINIEARIEELKKEREETQSKIYELNSKIENIDVEINKLYSQNFDSYNIIKGCYYKVKANKTLEWSSCIPGVTYYINPLKIYYSKHNGVYIIVGIGFEDPEEPFSDYGDQLIIQNNFEVTIYRDYTEITEISEVEFTNAMKEVLEKMENHPECLEPFYENLIEIQ